MAKGRENKKKLDKIVIDGNGNDFLADDGTYKSAATESLPWGSITGSLSDQTDLQTALDGKSDIAHNHDGVYEPADSTIVKDADIGVTVQPYDANIVSDSAYVHTDSNFTAAEKAKLAGIEDNANNYAHPATHPASMVTLDTTNFDHNLSSSDTNVQAAMETIDEIMNGHEVEYFNNTASAGMISGDLSLGTTVTTKCFAVVKYTGNGTSQSIDTGISSIDFTVSGNGSGYWLDRSVNQVKTDAGTVVSSGSCECNVSKVQFKNLDDTYSHSIGDGLRGVDQYLYTDLNQTETFHDQKVTAYTSTGVTVGSHGSINANGNEHVLYQTLYTHIKWGATAGGKFYCEAYNPVTKEMMVYYVGEGSSAHEIPHSINAAPDYFEVKNMESTVDWWVYYGDETNYLVLNGNNVTFDSYTAWNDTAPDSTILTVGSSSSVNNTDKEHIIYGFANSDYKKVMTYNGLSASNKLTFGFQPAGMIFKRLNLNKNWTIHDNRRGSGDHYVKLDTLDVENTSVDVLTIESDGVTLNSTGQTWNETGGEYIVIAFNDTDSNGGDTYFDKPIDGVGLAISDAYLGYTNGKDVKGFKVTSEYIESDSIDFTGVSDGEVYVYKTKGGSYGFLTEEPKFDGTDSGSNLYFNVNDGFWYDSSDTALSTPISFIAKVYVVSEIPQSISDWFIPADIGNTVMFASDIQMVNLPTSDPFNNGQLWNDNGTLKISSGS